MDNIKQKPYTPVPTWFFEKLNGEVFACEERESFHNIYKVAPMNRHMFKLVGFSNMEEFYRKIKEWGELNKGKKFGPRQEIEKGVGGDEVFALINNPTKADIYNKAFEEEIEIARKGLSGCPMPREKKVFFSESVAPMNNEQRQRIINAI